MRQSFIGVIFQQFSVMNESVHLLHTLCCVAIIPRVSLFLFTMGKEVRNAFACSIVLERDRNIYADVSHNNPSDKVAVNFYANGFCIALDNPVKNQYG